MCWININNYKLYTHEEYKIKVLYLNNNDNFLSIKIYKLIEWKKLLYPNFVALGLF